MKHTIVKEPLDAEVAAMLQRWKDSGIPDIFEGDDAEVSRERGRQVRAMFYPKPQLPKGRSEKLTIPGPAGEIPVEIVWPHEGEAKGALVYLHGGGWIVGDLDSHQAHALRIANETDSVVVNVGYRLAPEHRFPAAADDCEAATQYVWDHIEQFGGDRGKLAIGGDSAGGNMTAVVSLYARDHGIRLSAQLLLYPATNLTGRENPDVAGKYLGPDFAVAARDPRVSPALAPSLAGVAPAILGVGIHDFLYEDNMAYAKLLREAGVPLTLREFPTLNHGFFSYTAVSKVSLDAAQLLCADLRKALHG